MNIQLVWIIAGLGCGALRNEAHAQGQQEPPVATVAPTQRIPPAPLMSEVSYLAPAKVPQLQAPPKRYVPPKGFGGHLWGERREAFTRLPSQARAVRAAWTRGKERAREYTCSNLSGLGNSNGGPISGCTVGDVIRSTRANTDGGGFHALSEYSIEGQGFKFSDTGVLLYPVVYQFCANWNKKSLEVPDNFDELNKFCGMRMLFDTEALSQLRDLPADHVTRYELVLAELIAHYGKPAGFMWRGRVTIEPFDESAPAARSERKFSTWRWCPAPDEGLQTSCHSSIVLSIDPDLGRGIVLFSTPALWQYAYARETGFSQPDPLFTLMHALQPKERERLRQQIVAEKKAKEERAARIKAVKEEKAARKKAAKANEAK